MSTTELIKSDTPIGSIFFSGSQTVTKGNAVTWILDDTWAFKATEKCKVSTNASPFVEIGAGQTFLIYKRTQDDIDAGNSKGIYIFDRDTVVALAYPQEVTQDLIIENENYNNINNTIIIEADKTPVAKISFSNTSPVVGETITISGAESYAHSPATIQAYEWTINGAVVSTAKSFTRSFPNSYEYDVSLKITDNDQHPLVGFDKRQIKVRAVPTYADIAMTYEWAYAFGLIDASWRRIGTYTANKTGTGRIEINASAPLWTLPHDIVNKVNMRVLKGTSVVATGSISIPVNVNQGYLVQAISAYNGSVSNGDKFYVEVQQPNGSNTNAVTDNTRQGDKNQLQVKITNRTA